MTIHYIYNKVAGVLPTLLLCTMAGTVCAQRMEAVDLGLSVEWANMNVGADSPEDYGDYFAWGEVKPKMHYGGYSSYKHFDAKKYHKYNYLNFTHFAADNILTLQPVDDAATKNLGQGWRMPTEDEMQELLTNCNFVPEILNGTHGYRVSRKGKTGEAETGNSIFLPSAGYRDYGTFRLYPGTKSYYWTSTLLTADSLANVCDAVYAGKKSSTIVRQAKCMTSDGGIRVVFQDRRVGCVIRPVRNKR